MSCKGTKVTVILLVMLLFQLAICERSFAAGLEQILQAIFPDNTEIVSEEKKDYTPEEAVMALNYCTFSLTKGVIFNDRIILEKEYENIINNLNLESIRGDIVYLQTNLMGFLTETSLKVEEKERFESKYQKKVQRAIISSISQAISGVRGMHITTLAVNSIASVGSAYFSYQNALEDYREELDDQLWQLKASQKMQLNYLREDFFKAACRLQEQYNFPDKYRLTENQIENFITILKDRNAERKYRLLYGLKDSFGFYPPYWFHLGSIAQQFGKQLEEDGDLETAQEYYEKALVYYASYESQGIGIFRKDPYVVSICMNRINLSDNKRDRAQILFDLEKLLMNSRVDEWNNFLFAALKYRDLGEEEKAQKILQYNIDYLGLQYDVKGRQVLSGDHDLGYLIHLHKWLRDNGKEKTSTNLEALYKTILSDDRTRYAKAIESLGDLTPKQLMTQLTPLAKGIKVSNEKIRIPFLKKGIVKIIIPINWLVGNVLKEDNIFRYELPKGEMLDFAVRISKEKYTTDHEDLKITNYDQEKGNVTIEIKTKQKRDEILLEFCTHTEPVRIKFEEKNESSYLDPCFIEYRGRQYHVL